MRVRPGASLERSKVACHAAGYLKIPDAPLQRAIALLDLQATSGRSQAGTVLAVELTITTSMEHLYASHHNRATRPAD